MPIIENLEQDSPQWHEYRSSHIMGTDVSIILGSNPFKTKLELWEEKLKIRPPQKSNPAMERGKVLEPHARKLASELLNIDFRPVVMESTKYPWMAASLDGVGGLRFQYILEIKSPNEKTHLEAINGIIPEYYADQTQTQLICSESEICYYFSYRPEYTEKPYAIIEVYPDIEKQAEIIAKGQEFYVQMCTMCPPVEWQLKKR